MDPEEVSRALSALSKLPIDDPARLRVERVAESFVRDGRQRRKKEQRLRREAADVAVLAASVTGAVGRREDAAARVPDELVLKTNLLGTEAMVRQRIEAYRQAGVTTLRVEPAGETLDARMATLGRLIELVRDSEKGAPVGAPRAAR